MCSDVIDTRSFRNMLKLSQEESPDASTPIEPLTYGQLQVNYRKLKAKLNSEKLENLNLKRRNVTANKRATLNDRFMNTIASNDIPRLHILLQVCKDKGMGMRSILGRIDDAINRKYKPKKYGEEDWDKALLVVAVGNVGYGGDIKPILTLPTCSKSVNPQFEKMFEAVIKKLSLDIVATDGDASRRRFFNGRMKLVKDNEMKCFLKQLELFDLNFVDKTITLATRLKVFQACFRTAILSNCEAWGPCIP